MYSIFKDAQFHRTGKSFLNSLPIKNCTYKQAFVVRSCTVHVDLFSLDMRLQGILLTYVSICQGTSGVD